MKEPENTNDAHQLLIKVCFLNSHFENKVLYSKNLVIHGRRYCSFGKRRQVQLGKLNIHSMAESPLACRDRTTRACFP